MDPRYRETMLDPEPDVRRRVPTFPRVNAEERRASRTVCKVLVPPASPGAISTNCPNKPISGLGFCAEHFPK